MFDGNFFRLLPAFAEFVFEVNDRLLPRAPAFALPPEQTEEENVHRNARDEDGENAS